MIRQPSEDRGYNQSFLMNESRRIELLNQKFFSSVGLTEDEERYLVWMCSWNDETLGNIVSAFEKAAKKG